MIHCQSTLAITAFLPSRGHRCHPAQQEKKKKGEVGETPQHRGCRHRFNPHQNYRRDSVCAFRTRKRWESFACWLEEMSCFFVFQWMIKLNFCFSPHLLLLTVCCREVVMSKLWTSPFKPTRSFFDNERVECSVYVCLKKCRCLFL